MDVVSGVYEDNASRWEQQADGSYKRLPKQKSRGGGGVPQSLLDRVADIESELEAIDGYDTGWVPMPLTSTFTNYGSGYNEAAYRVLNGVCYVRGLLRVQSELTLTGNLVSTLPAEAWPDSDMGGINLGGSGYSSADGDYLHGQRVDVKANGEIIVNYPNYSVINQWVALDACSPWPVRSDVAPFVRTQASVEVSGQRHEEWGTVGLGDDTLTPGGGRYVSVAFAAPFSEPPWINVEQSSLAGGTQWARLVPHSITTTGFRVYVYNQNNDGNITGSISASWHAVEKVPAGAGGSSRRSYAETVTTGANGYATVTYPPGLFTVKPVVTAAVRSGIGLPSNGTTRHAYVRTGDSETGCQVGAFDADGNPVGINVFVFATEEGTDWGSEAPGPVSRVEQRAGSYLVPHGTFHTIVINDTVHAVGGIGRPGGGVLVVPKDGLYLLIARVAFEVNSGGTMRLAVLRVNGSNVGQTRVVPVSNYTTTTEVTATRFLKAGDEVSMQGWQNSGGDIEVGTAQDKTVLSVTLLNEGAAS